MIDAVLRHRADVRTLLWALVLMPGVALLPYAFPSLAGWLLPVGLYLGFCAGVLSHNQNHTPTFRSRTANTVYAAWLSFFYGYPTFGWIPTHNINHHKFVNAPGDDTITWRYSRKNSWTNAWTYFFISTYWQSGPIQRFIRDARAKKPDVFRRILVQYAVVIGGQEVPLHTAVTGLTMPFNLTAMPALTLPCGAGRKQRADDGNQNRDADGHEFTREQLRAAEEEAVPLRSRVNGALREQPGCDAAPDSADAVASEDVERIVITGDPLHDIDEEQADRRYGETEND